MTIKTFNLTLEWAKMLTPNVKHFAFKDPTGALSAFTPGQFITLQVPFGDKPLRRSYSLANIPGQSDLIEFAAGYVQGGPSSQYLFNLQPGDLITAGGPFGRLTLGAEHPARYIFMATSTGVTPFRTMLPALSPLLNAKQIEVVLLQGVRKPEDLLYREDFVHFQEQHPQFRFYACYSQPDSTKLLAYEHPGYVQSLFSELALSPERDVVYLCGNPQMIDQTFDALKNQGFDARQVRREKYISS
jgi:ferredoxin-NADP reductase